MQQIMMLFKKTAYDELVKKVNAINSDKKNLKKKIKDVDEKIPDSSKHIMIQDFIRLINIDLIQNGRSIEKFCN